MKEEIFITNSYEETQKLGKEFAKKIQEGDIVALYGDLGSGKTTFVQGLAKGLGIKRRIISPTFIIIRNYELRIKNHGLGIGNFYHIDLYRVESVRDIEGLGINEVLNDPQNIVAIEWAERMGSLLPNKRIDVCLEYINENNRKIIIR